jgi:hypothetical protein
MNRRQEWFTKPCRIFTKRYTWKHPDQRIDFSQVTLGGILPNPDLSGGITCKGLRN